MPSDRSNITSFQTALVAIHSAVIAVFASVLVLQVFNSFEWRLAHDTPLIHYAAFMMDTQGMFPYRDIFETSMPGTFAFHYAIGHMFGYGDLAFRIVDVVLLGVLLATTYAFVSRFGRLPAAWAVVIFGNVYIASGQAMSLQRDYIGIIPVALALLCVPENGGSAVRWGRFALVGLLFGLSALIKPHLAVALPVFLGVLFVLRRRTHDATVRGFLGCSGVAVASFLLPLGVAACWLAANAALEPFVSMFADYLPLHSAMSGTHERLAGLPRIAYLVASTVQLGGYGALFLACLFGYHRATTFSGPDSQMGLQFLFIALCTAAYALYPAVAGKFWDYHWMPFAYFCSISAAFGLYLWPTLLDSGAATRSREALGLLILLSALTLQLNLPGYLRSAVDQLQAGPELHRPIQGRVDEMATWLQQRLRPGDSVQPLDWTGGSIHAMLIAEAKLATRFMYDYHFYHHVSSEYTQGLRKIFISELHDASPRFVIEVSTNKPWVSGLDSNRSFPELRAFLSSNYGVAFEGDGYQIHERIALADQR